MGMRTVTLGEICRFEYGNNLPERDRKSGDVAVYGLNGIVGRHDSALTKGPTIIVGRKGSIGQVAFSTTPCWPIDTTYYIDGSLTSCDLEWLALLLRGLPLSNLNKASGVPGLNRDDVYALRVATPNLTEQRRIAARLNAQLAAVEQARQAAQAQLVETDALQLAIYHDAFAAIVPVAVPPTFEPAPAGWHWTKLGDIAQLESGHTPSRSRPDWWGGDISWLSLTEIRALDGRWVDETQIRTNAAGIANSSARILPLGTVCFSRTASVGFVAIIGQPMATSQDFANWVCGDELEPEFLMHALIRSRQELRAIATGATHHTIYMPALASFHLCLPGRPTQQRIVASLKQQLAAIHQMRAAAQTRLAEIKALPARLLAQAFNSTDEGTSP